MLSLCRQRRHASRPPLRLSRKRLMRSTGHNVVNVGVPDKHMKYLSDLYTTLIDIKWRWNILIFVSGFVLTWVVFACVYYLLGYLHGDFENHSTDFAPCLENVESFTAAYLFSIETMMTIGYGSRSQTEECPGVFLAVMLQSIIGAGLQFALASVVVSKTRRAKRRSGTILFSDQVCIYEQDARLLLAVRIGDMRRSEIAGAHAQGYMVKKYRSKDGTFVPVRSFKVRFQSECGRDEIFFPWPTQIIHTVDEDSPLWSLARDELLNGKYELIVVIDGVSGATSTPFQARKSFHSFEMKWGYRFADLDLTYNSSGSGFMNLANFHDTIPASTPLCSAQDITNLRVLYSVNHPETNQTENQNSDVNHSNQTTADSASSMTADTHDTPISSDEKSSPTATPYQKALRSKRSHSMEESTRSNVQAQRRCSLGDMIRGAQGLDMTKKNTFRGDALNIYRHRRSITDTYLGIDIEEEEMEEDYNSSQAILSVVSQRSAEKRTDVRDIFKRRRSSAINLFFGTECESTAEETAKEVQEHT